MHEKRDDYGPGKPDKWLKFCLGLKKKHGAKSFLDYGCGKGGLLKSLEHKLEVQGYDPCVPEYNKEPGKADIVFCADVLEHVEEDKIDNVLRHVESLTKKVCFMHIATKESNKTLPDGRNTHILIKPYEWWKNKLETCFPGCEVYKKGRKIECLYEK